MSNSSTRGSRLASARIETVVSTLQSSDGDPAGVISLQRELKLDLHFAHSSGLFHPRESSRFSANRNSLVIDLSKCERTRGSRLASARIETLPVTIDAGFGIVPAGVDSLQRELKSGADRDLVGLLQPAGVDSLQRELKRGLGVVNDSRDVPRESSRFSAN